MFSGLVSASYIIAAIFFIFSLAGLSKHETSYQGNLFGIFGMLISLLSTIINLEIFSNINLIIIAMLIGGVIGIYFSLKVKMTEVPQLVAMLHSFVGLTAVLISLNSYLKYENISNIVTKNIYLTEISLGIFIGAITFSGSIIAYCKLSGKFSPQPTVLKHQNKLNLISLLFLILLIFSFLYNKNNEIQLLSLLLITIISLILGCSFVLSIGGADMPVVVSVLNSYSGWSSSITGFMLNNTLLIITGALVGSSGAILSYVMCKAMNRSITNVLLGGFKKNSSLRIKKYETEKYYETTIEETCELLKDSNSVVIVPGYGMAVAQAQYPIYEIFNKLCNYNIHVQFAIHPVAGRLPGHMNILLAEAKVPYNAVVEMEEINNNFSKTDTVLVIGANDIVNPSSSEDSNSPIFGMPVLEVWKARNVVVFKRSMNTGYSGIENPLFFKENTRILFGDAKKSVEKILNII